VGTGVAASAARLRVLSLYWSLANVCSVQSSSEAHREARYRRWRKSVRHDIGGQPVLLFPVLGAAASRLMAQAQKNVTRNAADFPCARRLRMLFTTCEACGSLAPALHLLAMPHRSWGIFLCSTPNSPFACYRVLNTYFPGFSSHQQPGLFRSPCQLTCSSSTSYCRCSASKT
jgi:hypothetical protein